MQLTAAGTAERHYRRLSAGRKPRLPASWRATRPSSIAMYFRSRRPSDTKQLFDKLTRDRAVAAADQRRRVVRHLLTVWANWRLLRRVGGYDGRGQRRLRATKPGNRRMTAMANVLLERGIHFPAKCR